MRKAPKIANNHLHKKIALVGLGAIGSALYAFIAEKRTAWEITVYDKDEQAKAKVAKQAQLTRPELTQSSFDLVVETASREAVVELLPELLWHSSVLPLSQSAFADQSFLQKIVEISKRTGKKIYVPEGALIGSEAILTLREVLKSVKLTTRKPPASLGLAKEKDELLFDGSARQACLAFPRNLNVAAILSLYGIGFDKTRVKLMADTSLSGNVHRLEAAGEGIHFLLEVASAPSPQNPRSSRSILHSLIRTLDRFAEGEALPDIAMLTRDTTSPR